jgi:hypothetical protein
VLVVRAILREPGKIMVEGRVDDGIRLARAVAKAFQILQRAAMDFRARGSELLCSGIGTGESQHLVA